MSTKKQFLDDAIDAEASEPELIFQDTEVENISLDEENVATRRSQTTIRSDLKQKMMKDFEENRAKIELTVRDTRMVSESKRSEDADNREYDNFMKLSRDKFADFIKLKHDDEETFELSKIRLMSDLASSLGNLNFES